MKLKPEHETQIEFIRAGYDRGYKDCTFKIHAIMKGEMEKNKNDDWRSLLTILENHLTGGNDAKK